MLDLQTCPEEWVDQDSQVIEDIGILKDEVKSSSELGIYVQSDEAFSDESVAFVHDLAVSSLDEHEELLTASSIVTTVSFLIEMPDTTQLPPRGIDVANAYALAPPGIKASVAEIGRANVWTPVPHAHTVCSLPLET